MEHNYLNLDEQVCFPFYAVSRLITRAYQPLLEQLGLTYPQYLVMLVLWEQDKIPLNVLCERLILNTNTLTPLVKKLTEKGFVHKERSTEDERAMCLSLTPEGLALKAEAQKVPQALLEQMGDEVDYEKLEQLKQLTCELLEGLKG